MKEFFLFFFYLATTVQTNKNKEIFKYLLALPGMLGNKVTGNICIVFDGIHTVLEVR